MKKLPIALCFAIAFAVPTMVLADETKTTSTTWTYNGYDCELWSENNQGTTSMTVNGDNGIGANAKGGTFTASWSNTKNILFRCGRKFATTSGGNIGGRDPAKPAADYGNISIDFAATWNSNDNVRMLGVYGWAFYAQSSIPTKDENGTDKTFDKAIEYYIIQDRGSYNAALGGDTKSTLKGTATIDGIEYEFRVCDRIGRSSISGAGKNFKQYFSVPKSTSKHRTSGTISVSKHFEEWKKVGMLMDGPLYEVAMKVESYSESGANGSATVTKNILTVGGTATPSSNSGGSSSSSGGTEPQECGEYKTSFCGGLGYGSVYSNSTSMPSTGDCIYIGDFEVIQPTLNSTVAINGVENTCGDDWADCPYNDKPDSKKDGGYYVYVKTGSINSHENNGWKGIVAKAKPACPSSGGDSPSSSSGGTDPILKNRIPVTNFSIQTQSNKTLRIETNAPTIVDIFDLRGNKVTSLNVSGSQTIRLSLPSGIYFAKTRGIKSVRFVLR